MGKVLSYTDDVVNDFSPITLSNDGLSDTAKMKTTMALTERVDRILINLHQKGNVKLNQGILFFPLEFQWLKHDICQCCLHHRSLEARSRT